MNRKVMFSSAKQDWETPPWIFKILDEEFHFTLDPCATAENAKCARYMTKEINGLKQSWRRERVFVNPPFGRDIWKWVRKAFVESRVGPTLVVMLIPARTDTSYWHDWIFGKAEIRFLRGRITFEGPSRTKANAPFPSAVVIFGGRSLEARAWELVK